MTPSKNRVKRVKKGLIILSSFTLIFLSLFFLVKENSLAQVTDCNFNNIGADGKVSISSSCQITNGGFDFAFSGPMVNVDLALKTGGTITIGQGASLVLPYGKKIFVEGGQILVSKNTDGTSGAEGLGALLRGSLYLPDNDGDGYPDSSIFIYDVAGTSNTITFNGNTYIKAVDTNFDITPSGTVVVDCAPDDPDVFESRDCVWSDKSYGTPTNIGSCNEFLPGFQKTSTSWTRSILVAAACDGAACIGGDSGSDTDWIACGTCDPGQIDYCGTGACTNSVVCDQYGEYPTCTPLAAPTWYRNFDGDAYGNFLGPTLTQCTQPAGYLANNYDCDDTNSSVGNTGSRTRWASATAACNSSCTSEPQTCSNGSWTGTYTADNCSVTSCAAGQFCNSGTCANCEVNNYCTGDGTRTPCPTNSTTGGLTTASSLSQCLGIAGYYNCQSGTCSVADYGYYSGDLSNSRNACHANSSTETTTSAVSTLCLCNAGYYSATAGSCTNVTINHYSPALTNTRSACPTNSTTNGITTASEVSQCLGIAGYYNCQSGTCSVADTGWWSAANNNGRTQCHANSSTETTTSSSSASCLCNAGYYSATAGSCTNVTINHYSPALTNTRSACPTNSTTNGITTASEVSQCLGNAGYYNCQSGTCDVAGTGWWSPANSNSRTECHANSTTSTTTSSSSASCLCNAGYYSATAGSCSACGGNAYYCAGGASRTDVSSGYYSTGGTPTTRTGEEICPIGSYCSSGVATVCIDGTYNDSTGQTSCSNCGSNSYYCNNGTRNTVSTGYYTTGGDSSTRTGQEICDAGTYCIGGVSNICPAGQWNSLTGRTICTYCSSGYTSPEQSTTNTCFTCVGGYYSPDNSNCSAAEAGYRSPVSDFRRYPCNSGWFSSSNTATNCSYCLSGTYSPTTGAISSCTVCENGTYQDTTTQSSCKDCPTGYTNSALKRNGSKCCYSGSYGYYTSGSACTFQ